MDELTDAQLEQLQQMLSAPTPDGQNLDRLAGVALFVLSCLAKDEKRQRAKAKPAGKPGQSMP